jgi:hypothetical protein
MGSSYHIHLSSKYEIQGKTIILWGCTQSSTSNGDENISPSIHRYEMDWKCDILMMQQFLCE